VGEEIGITMQNVDIEPLVFVNWDYNNVIGDTYV
jgi:hypothetical protein